MFKPWCSFSFIQNISEPCGICGLGHENHGFECQKHVFLSFGPTGFSWCFSMFPGLGLLFTSRRSPAISGPILSCRLQRRCADVSVVVSWHHAAVLHVAGCLWGPIPTHGAETDELKLDIVGRWKGWKRRKEPIHSRETQERMFNGFYMFLHALRSYKVLRDQRTPSQDHRKVAWGSLFQEQLGNTWHL